MQLDKIKIPQGDILIHCGDALLRGEMFEFYPFVKRMKYLARRFKLTLYIPGNHDRCVEQQPGPCRALFQGPNMKMLLHEPFEWKGIKFFGSPFTPVFFDWAFMYPHQQAERMWSSIPDDTDIVITHGPAWGTLDQSGQIIGEDFDNHAGCRGLRDRLAVVRPKLHAFGHLHLQGGTTIEQDGILSVNAAICDDQYKPTRKPVVIEYDIKRKHAEVYREVEPGNAGSSIIYQGTDVISEPGAGGGVE